MKEKKGKGDFTAGVRLIWISAVAIVVGVICAYVARLLIWLIAFFTNLFYLQQISVDFSKSPADGVQALTALGWGWVSILIPALGGLIIGFLARYGSDRIRGHGIPEAMEAILIGQSRMQPKVAILKPVSSAISIGSGGPFGAEGPIIMTGGAFGSIIAQAFQMTAAERKTLLVAGAAGGMAATFGTPVAAVILAVELLLFEWKPRSFVPVALASAAAALMRPYMFQGQRPLFPVLPPHDFLPLDALLASALVGFIAGALSFLLTVAVYAAEDTFYRVPIHWMWWPAIGGLAVGIGGLFQPHALGVGYDNIERFLQGDYMASGALIGLMVVKCLIWAISLGSGTSGGVLAPLLIMGGALGALESSFLPGDNRLWPLVSMAAVMGGTMRSPLTGAVFALELTGDVKVLPALLIACVIAHAFTVLVMKRSILTEKVARRGYHVSREYSVDPLERLSVGDVMTTKLVTIPASMPVKDLITQYFFADGRLGHQGYPIVDDNSQLLGIVTRSNLLQHWFSSLLRKGSEISAQEFPPIIAYDLIAREPITALPWESCRTAAERMAAAQVGRLLVVTPEDSKKLVGIVTRSDLLKPRAYYVEEEARRERFIGTHLMGLGSDKNDQKKV